MRQKSDKRGIAAMGIAAMGRGWGGGGGASFLLESRAARQVGLDWTPNLGLGSSGSGDTHAHMPVHYPYTSVSLPRPRTDDAPAVPRAWLQLRFSLITIIMNLNPPPHHTKQTCPQCSRNPPPHASAMLLFLATPSLLK